MHTGGKEVMAGFATSRAKQEPGAACRKRPLVSRIVEAILPLRREVNARFADIKALIQSPRLAGWTRWRHVPKFHNAGEDHPTQDHYDESVVTSEAGVGAGRIATCVIRTCAIFSTRIFP